MAMIPVRTWTGIAALYVQGLNTFAWTIDDPAVMAQLAPHGLDGIISNRPDLLASVVRGSG